MKKYTGVLTGALIAAGIIAAAITKTQSLWDWFSVQPADWQDEMAAAVIIYSGLFLIIPALNAKEERETSLFLKKILVGLLCPTGIFCLDFLYLVQAGMMRMASLIIIGLLWLGSTVCLCIWASSQISRRRLMIQAEKLESKKK